MNGQEIQEYLDRSFVYHVPKDDQTERYQALRAKARELAYLVIHSCPSSRETSLALTNLEQAILWANAAIARNE
jgi:uncharacterized membrane protein